MAKKEERTKKELKKAISPIFLLLTLVLLFYPPYFRGLFFDKELLPTQIAIGVLFFAWIIYKWAVLKEKKFFRNPADIAALSLVGIYLASFFVAANYRYALGEFLKYLTYFLVYYLVSDIARGEREKRLVLWTLVLSAFGVALVGIGAAAGTVNYPGAFVGGRINSTLQYPNTLAAYLTAALMLGFGLQAVVENRWQKALLAAINYTLFVTFLFTLSRAAWLMFPLFYLILLIVMPAAYRRKVFSYSLQCFAVGILVSPGLGSAISGGQGGKVWLWYFAGLILEPLIFYVLEKLSECFVVRLNPKVLLAVLVLAAIISGTGLYIAFNTEKPLYISHGESESESWKTSWYTIRNVKPNAEYVLKVTVTAKPGEKEGQWGGAILINSVDENGKSRRIHNEYFKEPIENQEVKVSFKTPEDSVKIQIGFSNYYPGTSVKFSNVSIFEASDIDNSRRLILAYRYIPDAVVKRIGSISSDERSFQGRLSFYRDALKMIKERPILGWGGGGWEAAYFAYQSYRYFTTEVHSFFLQLAVETGILGTVAFLVLLTVVIKYAVKFGVDNLVDCAVIRSSLSGAIVILGHSVVDFNLSLSAMDIFLWTLFGIVVTKKEIHNKDKVNSPQKTGTYSAWMAAALGLLLVISSSLLYGGYYYGQMAVGALQEGDLAKAKGFYEKAAKYDPLTASFKADLSQIYNIIGEQTDDKEYREMASRLREEAVSLDPYNTKIKTLHAASLLKEGKLEEGLSLLEEVTVKNPYNITAWETLAEAYEKSAEVYIAKGEINKAEQLLEKCLSIPERIIELNRKSPKKDPGVEKLTATKNLMLYLAKAEILLENPDKGTIKTLKDLVFAANVGVDLDENNMPDLFNLSGDGNAEVKQGESVKIISEGSSKIRLYASGALQLEEGESYEISMEVEASPKSYKVEVTADNEVLSSSDTNVLEFIAPKGADGKEAGIRVVINPNSEVVLKKILVYKK